MVQIGSRILALYLLTWALLECTYLPQFLYSLLHHLGKRGVFADQDYWSGYYMLETASLVLRIAALSLAVVHFWNAGPKVMRLFTPKALRVEDPHSQTKS
jgi:hypothetical protein